MTTGRTEAAAGRSSIVPAGIQACANRDCGVPFRRLGEGELTVFRIDQPLLWGLPETIRLKAMWLCGRCCCRFAIAPDPSLYRIRLIPKQAHPRQQAKIG